MGKETNESGDQATGEIAQQRAADGIKEGDSVAFLSSYLGGALASPLWSYFPDELSNQVCQDAWKSGRPT